MEFRVEPAVFARLPGMRIAAVVAQGLDNSAPRPALEEAWRAAWAAAGREGARYPNPQSHPHVRPWREAWRAMGVSSKDFPSSIEALLRRAMKGGEPFAINPLVDWYNSVSLRFIVPAGGFDLEDLAGPLELRLTRPGDTFAAFDAAAPLAVPAGEVAYATGAVVLTRHLLWRQARIGLLSSSTRAAILVSEVPGPAGGAVAEEVLGALRAGLAEHFGVTAIGCIVDEGNPTLTW